MSKIMVFVVDNQILFRMGIMQALGNEPDFDLKEATPDITLIDLMEKEYPDVILFDVDVPSPGGIDLAKKVIQIYPTTRVIALTSKPDNNQLFEVVKIGAVAYMSKTSTPEELVKSIRDAYSGKYPINDDIFSKPVIADQLLQQFKKLSSLNLMENVTVPITRRETEILNYVANGKSNKQIADTLSVSEQTIKNHVSSILRKLNANDRAHAAVLAMHHGWISIEEKKP